MDIAYLLRRAAREHPESPAVDDGRVAHTLGTLVARASRLANALDALGVPPGASVGVLSENRSEYIEIDAGIALGRRVRVALNARLHLEDFRFVVEDSAMQVLFHSAGHASEATALHEEFGLLTIALDPGDATSPWYGDLIEGADPDDRVRPGDDEDPAWITYTSGTTGRPKGVVLSHRALRQVAFNLLIELGPIVPGEQLVLTQALSHGAGYFVLPYLLKGAGIYVLRRFDPEEVWQVSTRDNVRTLKVVPAMLPPLLDVGSGTWGYETIIYGASPVPLPSLERALDRFGLSLVQIYGQSEAPMTITCLHKEDHLGETRLSAGRPWRSVAIEVRDDEGRTVDPGGIGELVVRAPHTMTGYHGNPEATAEVMVDGWLRTSDMARIDEQGFVYLQGRRDEMINTGGYNVGPRDVEDVLALHDAVQEVIVLGIPHPRWGAAVSAAVRLQDGADITGDDLIAFARPRLGMRTPKRVILVDAIPRTPYGKVDRGAVREQLTEVGPWD